MLKIPTENYRRTQSSIALEAIVDLTDEGAPRLTIELADDELVHRIPDFVEPVFEHEDRAMPGDEDERDRRIRHLEEQNAELRQYREALEAHAADLRGRLEAARAREVDRELLPDEARAIAAALWHYAGEADAFGRRP